MPGLRASIAWIVITSSSSGCLHLPSGRLLEHAPPLALPTDPPAGPCEEASWLSLSPARAEARGSISVGDTSGYVTTRTVTLSADGLAVLRGSPPAPLGFEQVDAALGEPSVLDAHRARMRRTRTVRGLTQPGPYLALMSVGLAGILGGLWIEDEAVQRPLVYGSLVPFGIGGVMAPVGLILPGAGAQARHGLRDVLFVAPEDDLDALAARIDAANAQTRSACALP